MTKKEARAEQLAERSGHRFGDYTFDPLAREHELDGLDKLRAIGDPGLRRHAWDLYWLLEAERNPRDAHVYGDESERRYP